MILLEAMAMEKPIVATEIEGIKEVLDNGKTGSLVPPKDSKVLAGAIIKMITHKENALNMGLAARKVVTERFGVDVMVEKHKEVYEELLQLNLK